MNATNMATTSKKILKKLRRAERVPKEIRKRDGRVVSFDAFRIANAVFKAFEASGNSDLKAADRIAAIVLEKLAKKHKGAKKFIPTVEELQDIVEETLIVEDYAKIAKAYILYRQKRAEIRREKQQILDKDKIDEVDKKFDTSALRVLRSRYLRKNDYGKVVESPKELFIRVALHVSLPEIIYDKRVCRKKAVKTDNSVERKTISDEKAAALEGKLKMGKFTLNRFHVKGLYNMFARAEGTGKTKITWEKLVKMMREGHFDNHEKTVERFYGIMVNRRFMPNTPTLANFGNYLGMGSACFALEIEDSIDSIMDTLKKAALIFKSGGGLGYNFSKLRAEGDYIKTTGGESSGPITFMRLFDRMTEVIKQGGIRRGANMGVMNSNHPDIEKFILAKTGNKALKNFNISVMIMPGFWEYYKQDKPYPLINPRTGEAIKHVSARSLLDRISYQAWESGEPGVIFSDRVNKYNPFFKALGPIETTNPCGELPLYPNESCNLGSINLWAFLGPAVSDCRTVKSACSPGGRSERGRERDEEKMLDWGALEDAVRTAVRFLDNVIDINVFPLPDIEKMSLNTRKIGLGTMGIANLLYDLGIPFNSRRARDFMEKVSEFVNYHSKLESIEIAKERGVFNYYKKSFYPEGKLPFSGFDDKKLWNLDWKGLAAKIKKHGIRNSVTTAIAPTGSISMIAGCSSGIEPIFSLAFEKNVSVGSFYYIDPVFEKVMLREGLFDEILIRDVVTNDGSVAKIPYIPPKCKKIFVTAHDISVEDHVRTLASFQKWVDSSISKTNNFPAGASVADVKKTYLFAYELGCKAVTVFRDKSIKNQVLVTASEKKKERGRDEWVSMTDTKAMGVAVYRDPATPTSENKIETNGENELSGKNTQCPNCKIPLAHKEGCVSCSICGWGLCV